MDTSYFWHHSLLHEHTHTHTHAPMIIFSLTVAHNLHSSVALHFALYLVHSISYSNISGYLCCQPDVYTHTHTHIQIYSLIAHSSTHLMSLCRSCLPLSLKWNVDMWPPPGPHAYWKLPSWFYPQQVMVIFIISFTLCPLFSALLSFMLKLSEQMSNIPPWGLLIGQ